MMQPSVLMVTGAYPPEISGAALQCRQLVRGLKGRVAFRVLTTAVDKQAASVDEVDGVKVERIPVDLARRGSTTAAAWKIFWFFVRNHREFQIVHLHGFSRKSLEVVVLSKLFRKRLMIKLTSLGHDDPQSMQRKGRLFRWAFRQMDAFVGVSPQFALSCQNAGIAADKFHLIPNGVDCSRFQPVDDQKKAELRRVLELPADLPLALFVGFFSREKNPHRLFEAWFQLQAEGFCPAGLILVGATRSPYYEVDPALADSIRAQAREHGIANRLFFIERCDAIERYYQAADCFVLPSSREGLPNALLEAMASGLGCIASRLPGVTDHLISDGVNGMLVPPGDVSSIKSALSQLLNDRGLLIAMGRRARGHIQSYYASDQASRRYEDLYQLLCGLPHPAPGEEAVPSIEPPVLQTAGCDGNNDSG